MDDKGIGFVLTTLKWFRKDPVTCSAVMNLRVIQEARNFLVASQERLCSVEFFGSQFV
jgi:hypothetical protein